MEENESKTTAAAAAAAEQPDNGRVDVEETSAPRDGEGRESVTVVVIAYDDKHGYLMARSAKNNLIGVDADIHLVTDVNLKDTEVETLLAHLPYVKTERIILMTDGMMILNPVTICEVGIRKSLQTHLPMLMHKSVLEPLLTEMRENMPHADVMDTYSRCVNTEVAPLKMERWDQDNWLLPVVSKNPPLEALEKWSKTQRFAWISPQSWTDTVVKFLEDRFPE